MMVQVSVQVYAGMCTGELEVHAGKGTGGCAGIHR